ncbi:hypothetical protein MMC27_007595 [Xylographa pallens]|nr:hypothetical protein [Xylographa pallens]
MADSKAIVNSNPTRMKARARIKYNNMRTLCEVHFCGARCRRNGWVQAHLMKYWPQYYITGTESSAHEKGMVEKLGPAVVGTVALQNVFAQRFPGLVASHPQGAPDELSTSMAPPPGDGESTGMSSMDDIEGFGGSQEAHNAEQTSIEALAGGRIEHMSSVDYSRRRSPSRECDYESKHRSPSPRRDRPRQRNDESRRRSPCRDPGAFHFAVYSNRRDAQSHGRNPRQNDRSKNYASNHDNDLGNPRSSHYPTPAEDLLDSLTAWHRATVNLASSQPDQATALFQVGEQMAEVMKNITSQVGSKRKRDSHEESEHDYPTSKHNPPQSQDGKGMAEM